MDYTCYQRDTLMGPNYLFLVCFQKEYAIGFLLVKTLSQGVKSSKCTASEKEKLT